MRKVCRVYSLISICVVRGFREGFFIDLPSTTLSASYSFFSDIMRGNPNNQTQSRQQHTGHCTYWFWSSQVQLSGFHCRLYIYCIYCLKSFHVLYEPYSCRWKKLSRRHSTKLDLGLSTMRRLLISCPSTLYFLIVVYTENSEMYLNIIELETLLSIHNNF